MLLSEVTSSDIIRSWRQRVWCKTSWSHEADVWEISNIHVTFIFQFIPWSGSDTSAYRCYDLVTEDFYRRWRMEEVRGDEGPVLILFSDWGRLFRFGGGQGSCSVTDWGWNDSEHEQRVFSVPAVITESIVFFQVFLHVGLSCAFMTGADVKPWPSLSLFTVSVVSSLVELLYTTAPGPFHGLVSPPTVEVTFSGWEL